MDFLTGAEEKGVLLGKKAGSTKLGKLGFDAQEGEEEDLFAEFELGELDVAAAAPNKPEGSECEDAGKDAGLESPAWALTAKATRPPLHPGKPTAVQQQVQPDADQAGEDAQDSCSGVKETSNIEEQQQDEQEQRARKAAANNEGAIPLIPASPPAQPGTNPSLMLADNANSAEAVATALSLPRAISPNNKCSKQPASGGAEAAAPTSTVVVPGPEADTEGTAIPQAAIQAMQQDSRPAEAQVLSTQHPLFGSQPAAAPKPPNLVAALKPILPKSAAPPKAGLLPKQAPRLLPVVPKPAAGLSIPNFSGILGGGDAPGALAPTSSPSFQLMSMTSKQPGAAAKAPSRLNPQVAGTSFALPQQRQQPAPPAQQPALCQPTGAPVQRQQSAQHLGTPSFVLPKHLAIGTPAPFTPVGHPALVAVPASAEKQAAQETALGATVLADEVLAFRFESVAARVLEGHGERMKESMRLAEPMADEVQQQLMALEQAHSFCAATQKADDMWSELSAYQPPAIQILAPAQLPRPAHVGGEEDSEMAEKEQQQETVTDEEDAGAQLSDDRELDNRKLHVTEGEAMESEGSPVQPRALEAAFNQGAESARAASSSLGVEQIRAGSGSEEVVPSQGQGGLVALAIPPDTEQVFLGEEPRGSNQMEVDEACAGGVGVGGVSLVLKASDNGVSLSLEA